MSFSKEKITTDVQKLMLRDLRRELVKVKKNMEQLEHKACKQMTIDGDEIQTLLDENQDLRSEIDQLRRPSIDVGDIIQTAERELIKEQKETIEKLQQRVTNISKEYNESYGRPTTQNAKITDEMLKRIMSGADDNRS